MYYLLQRFSEGAWQTKVVFSGKRIAEQALQERLEYNPDQLWRLMPEAGRSKSSARVAVICLECGRKFATASVCPSCPKCGGSDVEPR